MNDSKVLFYVFCLLLLSFDRRVPVEAAPTLQMTKIPIFAMEKPMIAPEPDELPAITPTMPADNIPLPNYDYGCEARDGIECVNDKMRFDEQVAHVLFKEGASDGLQLSVDLLQVIDNRAVNAWECSINDCGVEELESLNPQKIPWSQITDGQAERLVLYLLSIPYTSRGETHPVWNGWSQPLEMAKVKELYPRKFRNYQYTLKAVSEWRRNCIRYDHSDGNDTCIFLRLESGKTLRPQHAICAQNILYVYMTRDELLPDPAPVVAYDKLDYGDFVVYVQFLPVGGYQFDEDR